VSVGLCQLCSSIGVADQAARILSRIDSDQRCPPVGKVFKVEVISFMIVQSEEAEGGDSMEGIHEIEASQPLSVCH
jgi:hypothetical protein